MCSHHADRDELMESIVSGGSRFQGSNENGYMLVFYVFVGITASSAGAWE